MLFNMCRKCKTPVRYPVTHCPNCHKTFQEERKESNRITNRKYDNKRNKVYVRFYNCVEWKRLSNAFIESKVYKCEGKNCNKIATDVHHIKPIQTSEGWSLRFEWSNLKALCVRCHNKEHNRF